MRAGTDYLSDMGFESGMGRWLTMGNHVQSHVTSADAHGGSRCLKVSPIFRELVSEDSLIPEFQRLAPGGFAEADGEGQRYMLPLMGRL